MQRGGGVHSRKRPRGATLQKKSPQKLPPGPPWPFGNNKSFTPGEQSPSGLLIDSTKEEIISEKMYIYMYEHLPTTFGLRKEPLPFRKRREEKKRQKW